MNRTPDALALARLSDWAYSPVPMLRSRLAAQGWRLVAYQSCSGTQVALVAGDGWYALVFRGTQITSGSLRERARDIWTNLRLWPRRWGEGRAHSGYSTALDSVLVAVKAMIATVPPGMPLYITGHSLGGALASLCAAWAADRLSPGTVAGLVTFGAPQGLSGASARYVRETTPVWRYVKRLDIAASGWAPGYSHGGPAIALPAARWWHGPYRRHGAGGYVKAVLALESGGVQEAPGLEQGALGPGGNSPAA